MVAFTVLNLLFCGQLNCIAFLLLCELVADLGRSLTDKFASLGRRVVALLKLYFDFSSQLVLTVLLGCFLSTDLFAFLLTLFKTVIL